MAAELAFYPAVALLYFFAVLRASQEDRVELHEGASVNVFLLFVLAQPACLLLGSYTGMATYLLTALVSYNFLPWRDPQEVTPQPQEVPPRSREAGQTEKKKKKKE